MNITKQLARIKNKIQSMFGKNASNAPSILDGSTSGSQLEQYYKAQLDDSMTMVAKDASFRYKRFGEQLQKNNCLDQIKVMLCVGCRNAYELNYFESLGIEKVCGIDLFSVDPRITVMDMHKMTFADSSFDALYSGDNFEHAIDLQQVANEYVRVVKPGGIIMLSVPSNTRIDDVDRHTFADFSAVYDYFRDHIDSVLHEAEVKNDEGTVNTLRVIFRTKRS